MTNSKILVSYFSASGITKKVAQDLSEVIGADIYEIKPAQPYTQKDLNWLDKTSRTSVEMKDWQSRPEMVNDDFSAEVYDTVFLGFPIWWYIAPTIINTFLEKHDFSNKKIILFATSGGSRFGKTVDNIRPSLAETAEIIEGDIFNHNPDKDALKIWAEKFI